MADFLDTITDGATDMWSSFDLNKFVDTAAQAYATIRKANQSPTTLTQPGTVRTLPDGSTARVNADGSLTIIGRAGQVQTVGTSGAVTVGGPQWIAGIQNAYLLGAAALLAVLILRR